MTPGKTVGALGEHELIQLIAPWVAVGAGKDGSFGIGDDCASLPPSPHCHAIFTTDLLIEGTHFLRLPETNWKWVGYKAAAANISDLAAAGARPTGLLVSIGLPPDFSADNLSDIYHGLHAACNAVDIEILGGDTTRAAQVTLSVTAMGEKPAEDAACLRSDARPGDNLFVTGNLGGSRAGLNMFMDRESSLLLIQRHFMPPLRVSAGRALATANDRVAMIDISDSLFNEARLLATASSVKLHIDLNLIPVHPEVKAYCDAKGSDPAIFALFSGEEYELLFALPCSLQELQEQLSAAHVNCPVTRVGTVTAGSGVTLLRNGMPVKPEDETFAHFR